ncbi:MAG: glycosyltransferase family 2 protein, partial [Chitinophagaceae bacterium]
IRTHLYKNIPSTIITDDFFISMQVQSAGLRLSYAPEAIAEEFVSNRLLDEWRRKKRISAGGFQSLSIFLSHLNPLRDPRFAFQFFSHRVLRWVVSAPALLLFFLSGTALFILKDTQLYLLCFYLQSSFLVLALLGCIAAFRRTSFLFSFPFYFLFMHAALVVGLFSLLSGKQTVLWNKASR